MVVEFCVGSMPVQLGLMPSVWLAMVPWPLLTAVRLEGPQPGAGVMAMVSLLLVLGGVSLSLVALTGLGAVVLLEKGGGLLVELAGGEGGMGPLLPVLLVEGGEPMVVLRGGEGGGMLPSVELAGGAPPIPGPLVELAGVGGRFQPPGVVVELSEDGGFMPPGLSVELIGGGPIVPVPLTGWGDGELIDPGMSLEVVVEVVVELVQEPVLELELMPSQGLMIVLELVLELVLDHGLT